MFFGCETSMNLKNSVYLFYVSLYNLHTKCTSVHLKTNIVFYLY